MKTLSTLALLTAATVAQAYTLDVNVGHSRHSGTYDDVSLIGLGVGSQLNNELHLGLNVSRKSIYDMNVALVDAKATSATLDLTYSLSPMGGIRPFVGAGVGAVRFTGDSIFTKNALSTKFFIGLAFPITQNVEFSVSAQNSKFHGVQELDGGPKATITSWDGIAALRFNF
jgi:opacity protein-like surface antigen